LQITLVKKERKNNKKSRFEITRQATVYLCGCFLSSSNKREKKTRE